MVCCALPMTGRAQFNMFFTSDHDLPNSLVNYVVEDNDGIVWVATEDGLCRYNGSRIKTYRHTNGDKKSLINNFVRMVYPDTLGNVIVCTIAGAQIYCHKHDDFRPIITNPQGDIRNSNVNTVLPLRSGGYIIGGTSSYTLYISKEGEPTVKPNVFTSQLKDIHRLGQSKDGSIWASVQGKGVYRAYPNHHGVNDKLHLVTDANGRNYDFSSFCNGADGKLYASGIERGIYMLNEKTWRFDLLPNTESFTRLRAIKVIPGTPLLCVASDGNGVRLFNCKTRQFESTLRFDDPLIDMSTQKVHSIYVNKNGDIWAALFQKGIMLASESATPFRYLGPRSRRYNLIGDRCVTSMMQDHENTVWVATDNGGLYGLVKESGNGHAEQSQIDVKQTHYFKSSANPDDKTSVPTAIFGLFEDSKHRMWFGSYQRGGGIVDKSTGVCHYIPLKGHTIFSIYDYAEDKRGTIWGASMGDGILRYDEANDCMVSVAREHGAEWSGCIFYDAKRDMMYAGTYDGVVSLSANDKAAKTSVVVDNCVVFSITRISDTTLAFSSNRGLILYDMNTGKTREITTKHGLPSNTIYACQPGLKDEVWISSVYGLTHLSLKNMDIENFTIRDGLQGNEFYKNASMRSRNGSIWFGGINGITYFRPSQLKNYSQECIVKVVGVLTGGKYITPNEAGEYYVSEDRSEFSVELSTDPIHMAERVVFSYRIDDGDWSMLSENQNSITVTNLDWGGHTIYTKTTINGHDSEITETHIYMCYPWYLKWWMVIIWIAIILIISYVAYRIMQRYNHERHLAQQRMRDEEEQKVRLQFFLNMVHDLRTPLTLINAPLKKLISSDVNAEHHRLYGIMERNVDRILRLTSQIISLRKIDNGKMKPHCCETVISEYLSDMARSMEDIINSKRVKLTITDRTDGQQRLWIDTEFMETIILNMLSNATKYTPEGGSIDVAWEIADGKLIISFTDTGIGISDEDKQHIFERFFQAYSPNGHVKGTGIGLNLVQSLVELHHGTISVADNPEGRGTRFTIQLPATKDAYSEDELRKDNPMVKKAESAAEGAGGNAQETVDEAIRTTETRAQQEASIIMQEGFGASTALSKTHKTVLIVDDDDEIRSFLTEELAVLYNILNAADGKAALDILNQKPVDIVVSDIMMPELDGMELCRRIRQNVRLAHIPVVLLTAKTSDQDHIEGLSVHADAYVAKPFNLELLMTIVGNLLMRHDCLRNTFNGNALPDERIETPQVQSADSKLMERLMKCINENLANPDLTSDMLASEVGLSRVHLYRKLKELTNQSASNFIRNIRLTKAAELLREHKANVSEVAALTGFRTPNHFSSAFKELYGVPPSEYGEKE